MSTNKLKLTDYKKCLAEKGWSYRTAAKPLGVCYWHLYKVLSGERKSISLLKRIQSLPNRPASDN